MRYAFIILCAILIASCGGKSDLPDAGPPDASPPDAGACTVGDVCAALDGCPCTVIDQCGCEQNGAQCQYSTCISDVDGSMCLVGHECGHGHCVMLPQVVGQSCDAGACDGQGACVTPPDAGPPDAGPCVCNVTADQTGYYSDSGCADEVLILHSAADAGTVNVVCSSGSAWNISGVLGQTTLSALMKQPQQWWFMHGGVCQAQLSVLAIAVAADQIAAVGQIGAACP